MLHGLYMDASGLPRFVALSNRYRLRFYIRPMQVEARWPQWNPLTHASFLPRTVMSRRRCRFDESRSYLFAITTLPCATLDYRSVIERDTISTHIMLQ